MEFLGWDAGKPGSRTALFGNLTSAAGIGILGGYGSVTSADRNCWPVNFVHCLGEDRGYLDQFVFYSVSFDSVVYWSGHIGGRRPG